jgi:uncharacterized protein (TIGR02001 family)
MRKSLLLAAVIGTFATSHAAMAEEAAPAAAPESPHSFSYNMGLYSQYIFRGLTQTGEEPALQGGVDYAHASGFYAGAWASNISWLEDADLYDNSSLEVDIYGGYAAEIGDTGIAYNVGVLQYLYPGDKKSGVKAAETTELYGSLGYGWVTGKLSVVVSDGAFGFDNADGSTYLELNADIPLPWYGLKASAHIGYQDFSGSDNKDFDYTDWKIGLAKSWDNGVNVGGFYTATDTDGKSFWTDSSGQHLAKDQFVFYVQKTF